MIWTAFCAGAVCGVAATWAVYRYRVLPTLIADYSIMRQRLAEYDRRAVSDITKL